MSSSQIVFLVGNPNSGKSSLFHSLTGIYQKVANYPGVTTEKKSGYLKFPNKTIEIVDLPGCYSLYPNSIDEKVVLEELLTHPCDFILFVADASNLNRSLLLLTQVSDLKIPIVLVINMLDELEREGETIHLDFLEKELNIKIFGCNSKNGKGIALVKEYLETIIPIATPNFFGDTTLFSQHIESSNYSYKQWHEYVLDSKPNAIIENTKRKEIIDRYNKIENILNLTIQKTPLAFKRKRISDKLDHYLLHPFWGSILLLAILFVVFQLLFTFASYPMEWLDSLFGYVATTIKQYPLNDYWSSFITDAIIPGIAGVLIFIPQIALLFIMNTLLEESGYMTRIVFLLDKLMRKFGMSGKSILPLISGNACAIPAIASTKTIPTEKERLITILTIPFMTCSARLPIYTLLISIVIPMRYQGLTLLALYILGGVSALILGWILNRYIKTDEKSLLIMEIPPFRLPSFKNIAINVKNAVFPFVKTAGKYIFTMSILLWFLASFSFHTNGTITKAPIEQSALSTIGHSIVPVIEPLGYDWKIGVSLLSSFAAREVFVSTLSTLYNIDSEDNETIFEKVKSQTYPNSDQKVFTPAVGISLLLFYAFALQCMSTLASMKKETGTWKYSIYSFVLMLILAYSSAFFAYQLLK